MPSNNNPSNPVGGATASISPNLGNSGAPEQRDRRALSAYLTGSALLFGAYFYFIAWIHLYFYYHELGISLMSLDIPIYYFLVYAYSAIDSSSTHTYLLIFLAILIFTILDRSWSVDKNPFADLLHRVALTTFILGLFIFGYALARAQGLEQAYRAREGKVLFRIHLALKDTKSNPIFSELVVADQNLELSLITETKETVYILRQRPPRKSALPIGFTYALSRKDLSYSKVDLESDSYSDSTLCGIPLICDAVRFIMEPIDEKASISR